MQKLLGKELILANPRGFCAGVQRAIDIVDRAVKLFGGPIYVKHEVVHNKYVIEKLKLIHLYSWPLRKPRHNVMRKRCCPYSTNTFCSAIALGRLALAGQPTRLLHQPCLSQRVEHSHRLRTVLLPIAICGRRLINPLTPAAKPAL